MGIAWLLKELGGRWGCQVGPSHVEQGGPMVGYCDETSGTSCSVLSRGASSPTLDVTPQPPCMESPPILASRVNQVEEELGNSWLLEGPGNLWGRQAGYNCVKEGELMVQYCGGTSRTNIGVPAMGASSPTLCVMVPAPCTMALLYPPTVCPHKGLCKVGGLRWRGGHHMLTPRCMFSGCGHVRLCTNVV